MKCLAVILLCVLSAPLSLAAPVTRACLTAQCVADYDSRKQSVVLDNGQRLAYIESGSAANPGVLLIHGYTDSARDWQPIEPYLTAKFHLIIVDLRGQGASDKPECCYTRFDFAYDLALLLRKLHIERVDVVGHSLGSLVAQTFTELWPEHTRKLILISSTGTSFGTGSWLADVQKLSDPIDPDSVFMRSWWQQSVSINPHAFSERQRRDAAAIPARVWRAIADQSLVGVDLAPMLNRIHAPTLLIWGARDTLVSAEGRDSLHTGIHSSRVKIFPTLGHDLFWEEPENVSASMIQFLTAQ
ncbi:MAG: alpha/beta hydrolase [Proteobacteria bacterium]|nr:alpha/beta hydrolase [Pseudomonadota bacterium]